MALGFEFEFNALVFGLVLGLSCDRAGSGLRLGLGRLGLVWEGAGRADRSVAELNGLHQGSEVVHFNTLTKTYY